MRAWLPRYLDSIINIRIAFDKRGGLEIIRIKSETCRMFKSQALM